MSKTWRVGFLRSSFVLGLAILMLGVLQSAVTARSPRLSSPTLAADQRVAQAAQPLTPTLELLRKLHPQLARQLLETSDDSGMPHWPIVVVMRGQPDLNSRAIAAAATPLERRAALIQELQSTATRSQAGVRAQLWEAQLAGRASEVRPLWINNSVAAHVDRDTLYALAARDDVALIKPDRYLQWIKFDPASSPTSNLQLPTSIEWNIAQIHADQVWSALSVTGIGVIVASIDTGVDWLHPALQTSYLGYNPKGVPNHLYSWFDATGLGALYPVDSNGHGTHTMGTMVGQGGIGVAPGARWIAARAFNPEGYAYDSWLHAAFQWILAPNGDANRAPDIVNNSWGNNDGTTEEFHQDVLALNAGGIAAFFSNGNSGPELSTVGAPASYPEAFGVGATDEFDLSALFSSRGPSPFGSIKPDVSAPGVNVRSSFPGGAYLELKGTSMAAPHVSGVAALVRSAAPGTSIAALRYALTSTAFRPTTDTYPNNIYGWGRVDAWRAVLAVTHTGVLSGFVVNTIDHLPVTGALLHAESAQGTHTDALTDQTGRYLAAAASGSYTLTVTAFGYLTETRTHVALPSDTITRQDFELSPRPTGKVTGHVTNLTGTQSLTAELSVLNTPLKVIVSGTYTLNLPAGTHVLQVQSPRHRVLTATVTITANMTLTRHFALPDAPRILLVDSGRWYNNSEIVFYQQALQDNRYLYDEWPILNAVTDAPPTTTLRTYDVVIWSSPLDSPGIVNAAFSLDDYLRRRGHLLLSGQDVAYYDAYWYGFGYLTNRLLTRFEDDDGPGRQLTGAGVYTGLHIAIAGAGGADNQSSPDVIASRAPTLTLAAFEYAPGQLGGQTVGLCRPYRASYLAYGLEAITDRATRAEVLSRTLDFFAQPPARKYYRFDHSPEPLLGPAGAAIPGSFDLYNFDEVTTTTFSIALSSAWSSTISPTLVTLAPCAGQHFALTVDIPAGAPFGVSQPLTISASPIGVAGPIVSTTLIAKAPGSVLLVDDDRWYEIDAPYRNALAANGISYDIWHVPTSWEGFEPSAPNADRMSWYPQVMWFTGYDWYQTITLNNEQALADYLARGGRVLISSQDYHNDVQLQDLTGFSHQTLGILDRRIDVTTTIAHGPRDSLLDGVTFAPLNPPYHKYIDALAPQPETEVVMAGDHGWPIALAHDMGLSKTLFLSFGFEGLPPAVQPDVMNRFVGYLSWLGRSGVKFDRRVARPGERVTATLVVRDDGPASIAQAAFTATLPPSATLISGDALLWKGSLLPGQALTRTWTLSLSTGLSAGSIITFPIELADLDHTLHFTTRARLRVTAPDLALRLQAEPPTAQVHDTVTWTLTARNLSPVTAETFIMANLPFSTTLVSGTLRSSAGAATELSGTLGWHGSISAQEAVTLTYQVTMPDVLPKRLWYSSAIATVGDEVWHAGAWIGSEPYEIYLPVLRK